jgi:hypothetical protein
MNMDKTDRITFKDKSGQPYSIGNGNAADRSLIMDMYRVFSPKPASQGLPPEDPETCEKWVNDILEIGANVLARRGETIIGHAALIPDGREGGRVHHLCSPGLPQSGSGDRADTVTFERREVSGFSPSGCPWP